MRQELARSLSKPGPQLNRCALKLADQLRSARDDRDDVLYIM
jgi:hypothetical protein